MFTFLLELFTGKFDHHSTGLTGDSGGIYAIFVYSSKNARSPATHPSAFCDFCLFKAKISNSKADDIAGEATGVAYADAIGEVVCESVSARSSFALV